MIRKANFDDLKELIELTREAHEFDEAPFSVKDSIKHYDMALTAWDRYVVVAPAEIELKGFLYAFVGPWAFANDYRISMAITFWVREKYRKQGVGKALVEAYVDWAKKAEADHIQIGHMMKSEDQKFYEKMGFELAQKDYTLKEKLCLG